MVIDSMFAYHFFDPDLRFEIISKKEGAAEDGGIDFELGKRYILRVLCC